MLKKLTFKTMHLCVGVGGGARGMQRSHKRIGNLEGRFRTLGGVDSDAGALRAFEQLTGVRGTHLDLFDRDQYIAFHGKAPPADWREALPEDLQRAAGWETPDVVFTSTPCKGLSALLPAEKSGTPKYQALNRLTLRAIWLALEAWKHDPPAFFLFENVPLIARRGRHLLDQIVELLRHYGYAVAESTHDCGEIGALAQTRRRFLLVARHIEKVPPFLYEPVKRPLRAIGEVLGQLPSPDDPSMGPMHRSPRLKWETWVRLALIPAGGDWRDLQKVPFNDFAIVPERNWHSDALGVAGAAAIADPRVPSEWGDYQAYGVRPWSETSGAITSQSAPGGGTFSVADPRTAADSKHFNNVYRVTRWDDIGPTVTSGHGPSSGGIAVADPRQCGKTSASEYQSSGHYGVQPWDGTSRAIVGRTKLDTGPYSVADPRLGCSPNAHRNKMAVRGWDQNAGVVTGSDRVGSGAASVADPRLGYGFGHTLRVTPWESTPGTITAARSPSYGAAAVADPRHDGGRRSREPSMPPVIVSLDGTWHRPITTLECAALQSFPVEDAAPWLGTTSHSKAREWIGNAVPPAAAEAMGNVILEALLGAALGYTFQLSNTPVWVRPVAIAIALPPHHIHDTGAIA